MVKTTQDAFHSMKGHVAEGTEITMNNGDVLTIKAVLKGWQLIDQLGREVAAPTNSAHVVSCIIYDYPKEFEV